MPSDGYDTTLIRRSRRTKPPHRRGWCGDSLSPFAFGWLTLSSLLVALALPVAPAQSAETTATTAAARLHIAASPAHAAAAPMLAGATPVHAATGPMLAGATPVHAAAGQMLTSASPVHAGAAPSLKHYDGAAATTDDDETRPIHEVVLWFRYASLIDTYVSARSDGERFYLPVKEIFTVLRIRCELDLDGAGAHGTLGSEARPYRIDFGAGRADINGEEHRFDTDGVVVERGDVYVDAALLDAWFGLEFALDAGEMSLSLRTADELPIATMYRRSAQRPDLHDPYALIRHAPLEYDRHRRNLTGGTLDYGLALSQDAGGTYLNADAAVGAEVLGGDLRWRAAAGHAQSAYFRQSDFLWRYARDDEHLSQVSVGTTHSTGLEQVAYHGVHVTNLPAAPRTYFSEYRVSGDVPPNWDVELYLDDRLVGFEQADPTGRYRFTVPIFYGTSMVRVKAYGPAGEVREDVQRIQIPFSLLASGDVHYNLHAGRARNSRRWMTQADVGYGVSERLSVTAGLDVAPRYGAVRMLDGVAHRDVAQTPLPYARLTSRVGAHYLTGVDLSPGGYNRISFSGFFPSHANVEVQGVRYPRASHRFADGRRHMLRVGGFVPVYVRGNPASLRLHVEKIGYDGGAQYGAGSSIYGVFKRFRLRFNGRGEWGREYSRLRLSPALSYTVSNVDHRILRHLSGMIVTGRVDYEMIPGRLERVRIDVTHNIRPRARLSATIAAGLHGAPTSAGFRLSVDLPTARAAASAQVRGHGSSSIAQSVRGSVVFDEANGTVYFDRRAGVGRSSAAVRLFIDENGDGHFDSGEPVVDDDIIRLRRGSSGFKQRSNGVTLVSGLLPYTRYTAFLDPNLLSNPMLVPVREAFSFIADPNSVKPIDIPLTPAGIVEGRVMEMRGEDVHPVAGAAVRLVREEDGLERILETFSDGTYYEMGLPPGTYDVRLFGPSDPARRCTPASRTVTIEPAVDGDVMDGLDFVLSSAAENHRTPLGSALIDQQAPRSSDGTNAQTPLSDAATTAAPAR